MSIDCLGYKYSFETPSNIETTTSTSSNSHLEVTPYDQLIDFTLTNWHNAFSYSSFWDQPYCGSG
jgi:hypothetical protein